MQLQRFYIYKTEYSKWSIHSVYLVAIEGELPNIATVHCIGTYNYNSIELYDKTT